MYSSDDEIDRLLRAFEACTLPRSQWTHKAHLMVALWYLVRYSSSEAIQRIRSGIQRYNAAAGIVTTKNSGYHETLTLFWICLVSHYLEVKGSVDSLSRLANELIEALSDRSLPFSYYSRDRLMSLEARTHWIEPDLRPLPTSQIQDFA
jgi:hypothetical protein